MDALAADWLGACRRAAEAVHDVLVAGGDRTRVTGTRGHGGDPTLVIDAEAEAAVFGDREGRLELLGIESADPRHIHAADLRDTAHRLRALGTIAVTLCQVAAARL